MINKNKFNLFLFKNNRGVSLIEVLLTMAIISIIVFLIASLPNSLLLITKSKHLSLAREIAVTKLDDLKEMPYSNLANGENSISDNRLKLLPSGSGQYSIEDCEVAICSDNEQAKTIKVKIDWRESNKPQSFTMKTLISEGGI